MNRRDFIKSLAVIPLTGVILPEYADANEFYVVPGNKVIDDPANYVTYDDALMAWYEAGYVSPDEYFRLR